MDAIPAISFLFQLFYRQPFYSNGYCPFRAYHRYNISDWLGNAAYGLCLLLAAKIGIDDRKIINSHTAVYFYYSCCSAIRCILPGLAFFLPKLINPGLFV